MKFNLRLISLVGLFLILALPVISPLLAQDETEWPAPTGAYQVGVTSRLWVDEARDRELIADGFDIHGRSPRFVADRL